MPIVKHSSYKAPLFFKNAHIQTVFPTLFRKVKGVSYIRERIITPDDDFIDLDWSGKRGDRCVILLHGLEGNSTRAYMLGMVKAMNRRGWDAVSFNMRGCSGEPNLQRIMYHSGATYDLQTVIDHVIKKKKYLKVALVGFSLGGNLTLKYLGEQGKGISKKIRAAAALSVPIDLASTSRKMANVSNRIYMKRFLRMLREKVTAKMAQFPGTLSDEGYDQIHDFEAYDNRYTAPIHGFKSADDYWKKSSARQFLPQISIPTLMISALDDPFLTEGCFPVKEAQSNSFLVLDTPPHGGHMGFVTFSANGEYWDETRAADFIVSADT